MTTLQAVIRLKEINEAIEKNRISSQHLRKFNQEFLSIKSQLMDSGFAFESVVDLIKEVEAKLSKIDRTIH